MKKEKESKASKELRKAMEWYEKEIKKNKGKMEKLNEVPLFLISFFMASLFTLLYFAC